MTTEPTDHDDPLRDAVARITDARHRSIAETAAAFQAAADAAALHRGDGHDVDSTTEEVS